MGCGRVFLIAAVILAGGACSSAVAGDVPPRMVIPFSGILDLKSSKVVLTLGLGAPEGSDGAGAVILEVVKPSAGRYGSLQLGGFEPLLR